MGNIFYLKERSMEKLFSDGASSSSSSNLLQLPEQYDLVVGDTFELFYKGISLCLDSDAFAYELTFSDNKSRGNNYTQKYIWTPTESDIGVHIFKYALSIRTDQTAAVIHAQKSAR